VCVAHMLCTAMGLPPPMVVEPMRTVRVGLRGRFTVQLFFALVDESRISYSFCCTGAIPVPVRR
jgi:hypothetical protein